MPDPETTWEIMNILVHVHLRRKDSGDNRDFHRFLNDLMSLKESRIIHFPFILHIRFILYILHRQNTLYSTHQEIETQTGDQSYQKSKSWNQLVVIWRGKSKEAIYLCTLKLEENMNFNLSNTSFIHNQGRQLTSCNLRPLHLLQSLFSMKWQSRKWALQPEFKPGLPYFPAVRA